METWEKVLVGAFALLLLFWVMPGMKDIMERSKMADKDWGGFLLPIGFVVGFVLLLILVLRA